MLTLGLGLARILKPSWLFEYIAVSRRNPSSRDHESAKRLGDRARKALLVMHTLRKRGSPVRVRVWALNSGSWKRHFPRDSS